MATKRLGSLALALTLGLTMVACGGGDDDKASTEDSTTTTGSDDGDGIAAFTEDCAELTQAFAGAYASIGAGFGAGGSELDDAAEYFENVADKLPKEIRADFQLFAEAYGEFAKAMAEADIDMSNPASMDPDQMEELQKIGESLEGPEIEEASANVQAYLEAKCGTG